jgi:outer membrane receptor protein involved in Fe transport
METRKAAPSFLLLALGSVLGAGPSLAQDNEIVVTAPRLAPLPGEAAYDLTTIEIPDDTRFGGLGLESALEAVPGFTLFRRQNLAIANPTTQGATLRGVGPNGAGRALVTLDGSPVADPFGGWIAWSSLPTARIGTASVRRGGGLGSAGPGALTGVIELQSRQATPGNGQLAATLGSEGLRAGTLDAGERIGRSTLEGGFAVQASDGVVPVTDEQRGRADIPLGFRNRTAWISVSSSSFADVQSRFSLSAFHEERGTGVDLGENRWEGFDASYNVTGSSWSTTLWAKTRDLEARTASANATRTTSSLTLDQFATPSTGIGGSLAWQTAFGGWNVQIGGDARDLDGETREAFRNLGSGFTRLRVAGGRSTQAGIYAEASWENGPLLGSLGTRVDGWWLSDGRRVERDAVTRVVTLDAAPKDRDGSEPSARAAVAWRMESGTTLRAAAYRGVRIPTLNELYRPFRVGNDVTEANEALTPETLDGVEIGFRWSADEKASVDATLSFNRLSDAIGNVTVASGPGTFPRVGFLPAGGVLRQRQNLEGVEAVTFETQAKWSPLDRLDLTLGYAGTLAEVLGQPVPSGRDALRPAQTPAHRLRVSADWTQGKVSVGTTASWTSFQWDDDTNSRRLAAALTADIYLAYQFNDDVSVSISAENLFGSEVESARTGDGIVSLSDPRRISVTLNRSF